MADEPATLPGREFLDPQEFYSKVRSSVLGCFFAFVTPEDAHSPVMLPVYDELVQFFEHSIPFHIVNARDASTDELRKAFKVYSAPTFLWVRSEDKRQHPGPPQTTIEAIQDHEAKNTTVCLNRTVGVVTLRKLQLEIEPLVDKIVDEL